MTFGVDVELELRREDGLTGNDESAMNDFARASPPEAICPGFTASSAGPETRSVEETIRSYFDHQKLTQAGHEAATAVQLPRGGRDDEGDPQRGPG